ncbi:hypothetical protein [Riemerella anatipestifer]|uniref:hypothetical protein n=2 Tax=Riemerella anatipestifer TaxID=34085 RepID=UPI0007EDC565|nr:hypothetical protein [Riemerella anatipestifer]AZZ58904.1 hypothetical protein AWB57_07595 [Riemerella anatipestifer]MBT0551762.1 hypothetical protein [Riemerella anatipestifer]MBT0553228.1 hypothetical protein [Riemerella anatipestifer]MBT0573276.1 hypothetical protein [Riemerella anatipestifer]MCE3025337.1 hypothetical protein [Riemerella anatipestifer]
MKKIILALSLCLSVAGFSQRYDLVEIKDKIESTDKSFFRLIQEDIEKAHYLGKLEVANASTDDKVNYVAIYNKAKFIGANAYQIIFPETIDGLKAKNKQYYAVLLYSINVENITRVHDEVYLFNIGDKARKLKIEDKILTLLPKSYYKISLTEKPIDVSVGGFLGSRIKLPTKTGTNNSLYFNVSDTSLRGKDGFLNLKTGDLERLDEAYANYLLNFYTSY